MSLRHFSVRTEKLDEHGKVIEMTAGEAAAVAAGSLIATTAMWMVCVFVAACICNSVLLPLLGVSSLSYGTYLAASIVLKLLG